VTRDSCTVTWSPPASDGGTPLVGYHVEQRLISRPSWVRVGPVVTGTSVRVPGLFDGQTYQFRVTAETRAGLGDPSPASTAVTARDPWTRPGPPTMPQLSDVTRKSCRVSWLPPTDDGGDDIRGYVVEYKVIYSLEFPGVDCQFMFTDTYHFLSEIGLKFQSLYKISDISTFPPVF